MLGPKCRQLNGFESKFIEKVTAAPTNQSLSRQRLTSGQEISVPQGMKMAMLNFLGMAGNREGFQRPQRREVLTRSHFPCRVSILFWRLLHIGTYGKMYPKQIDICLYIKTPAGSEELIKASEERWPLGQSSRPPPKIFTSDHFQTSVICLRCPTWIHPIPIPILRIPILWITTTVPSKGGFSAAASKGQVPLFAHLEP